MATVEQMIDTGTSIGPSSSPLSLFTLDEAIIMELRQPWPAQHSHWHGQLEINISFDDDVEYDINGQTIVLKQDHIAIFWATIPHRLVSARRCKRMGIINIPIHNFLSWPISQTLKSDITYGALVQSKMPSLVSEVELQRWLDVLQGKDKGYQQIIGEEIELLIKRVSHTGWDKLVSSDSDQLNKKGSSKHGQYHVRRMLECISHHHTESLTISRIAEHVGLHSNYAMKIFQDVMHMSIKRYITIMRLQHAKALLAETERSIYDIAITVGFNSASRFYESFQKYVKCTPAQYKALHSKMG